MPKYLILDKSALRGTQTDALCEFAEVHNVILSETLFYECVTTDEQKDVLLDRCRRVMLSGGAFCPSLKTIVQTEATDLKPYAMLVDSQYDAAVREAFERDARPYDIELAEKRHQEDKAFSTYITDNIERLFTRMELEEADILTDVRRRQGNKESRLLRLTAWAELVDTKDIHDMANRLLRGNTPCPERYCLSKEWVTWHIVRLFWIWFYERATQRAKGANVGETTLEHDWQDMTYITLLSRADGLLMVDVFGQELARAAFPEKEVFSSLEVPESYRCDLANP